VEARPGDDTHDTGGTGEPHADRDRVIETLKAAFVQGRLGKEEFDNRVGQVFAAYAELDAVIADIPAARPAAQSARTTREAYNKRLVARGTAAGAGGIGLAAAIAATAVSGNPFLGVLFGSVAGVFTAGILFVFLTILSWALEKNPGRQSSRPTPLPSAEAARRPAAAGQAARPRRIGRGQISEATA
jgi:Domain of unknown function (DUF1707)